MFFDVMTAMLIRVRLTTSFTVSATSDSSGLRKMHQGKVSVATAAAVAGVSNAFRATAHDVGSRNPIFLTKRETPISIDDAVPVGKHFGNGNGPAATALR